MEKDDVMGSENRDRPPRAAKWGLMHFSYLGWLKRSFRQRALEFDILCVEHNWLHRSHL